MQERVNEEFLWNNARWPERDANGVEIEILKIGQPYLLNYNARRGTKVVTIPQADGSLAVYSIQRIPEAYTEDCKRTREAVSAMSSTRRNALPMIPYVEIPDNIATNLFSENRDGGKQLEPLDPERDKRLRQFANDLDYYKFRTSEGTI